MDTELKLDLQNTMFQPRFVRGGDVVREIVYTYWLGKYGPFQFRTPADPLDPQAFPTAVIAHRAHLLAAQQV
jgi:hypothetical protein